MEAVVIGRVPSSFRLRAPDPWNSEVSVVRFKVLNSVRRTFLVEESEPFLGRDSVMASVEGLSTGSSKLDCSFSDTDLSLFSEYG